MHYAQTVFQFKAVIPSLKGLCFLFCLVLSIAIALTPLGVKATRYRDLGGWRAWGRAKSPEVTNETRRFGFSLPSLFGILPLKEVLKWAPHFLPVCGPPLYCDCLLAPLVPLWKSGIRVVSCYPR